MCPQLVFLFIAIGSVWTGTVAAADEFAIHVKASADGRSVQTEWTAESPKSKPPSPRPVFESERGRPLSISWNAQNTGRSATFEDVMMHFYIVRETKVGQSEDPKITDNVLVQEGAITMDFRPGDKADWQLNVTIDQPGAYLVRVETMGLSSSRRTEHWTAMDLRIK